MIYKSLQVQMKNYKLYYENREIQSYMDIINSYAEKGYTLFQILSLPNSESHSQLTLDIIMQKENEDTYKEGFPF